MTYQQFLTEIQLQIHSLFDTDVTIQLHKIQKNNGVTLDGLTILQKGCNISPTIYLNDYYKEYQAGKSIHNIILQYPGNLPGLPSQQLCRCSILY